jgi:hypothetical protein
LAGHGTFFILFATVYLALSRRLIQQYILSPEEEKKGKLQSHQSKSNQIPHGKNKEDSHYYVEAYEANFKVFVNIVHG